MDLSIQNPRQPGPWRLRREVESGGFLYLLIKGVFIRWIKRRDAVVFVGRGVFAWSPRVLRQRLPTPPALEVLHAR